MKNKSFFIFGPRATGKSSLIKHELPPEIPMLSLLRADLFLRLNQRPSDLEVIIDSYVDHHIVVIDEVQKIPDLLNEVHRLIEDRGLKFLLTGSRARK